MQSFKHLENTKQTKFDYQTNLFKRSLPIRVFTNSITSTFLIGIEQIYVNMIQSVRYIERYFRLD